MKPSINRLYSHKYLDQTALTALTNFLNVFKTCLKFLWRDVPRYPAQTLFFFALIALVLIVIVLRYRLKLSKVEPMEQLLHSSASFLPSSQRWNWWRLKIPEKVSIGVCEKVDINFIQIQMRVFSFSFFSKSNPQQKRKFHFLSFLRLAG